VRGSGWKRCPTRAHRKGGSTRWPAFQGNQHATTILYSYAGMHGDFEAFKAKLLSQSPEQLLEYALIELWRAGTLHNYRYRKLRIALRWLLLAIVLLFITIALSSI